MIRHSTHRNAVALRQRDIQNWRRRFGILKKQLVEISQPKKQQHILRQLPPHREVLLHHRSASGVGHEPSQSKAPPRRQQPNFTGKTKSIWASSPTLVENPFKTSPRVTMALNACRRSNSSMSLWLLVIYSAISYFGINSSFSMFYIAPLDAGTLHAASQIENGNPIGASQN